MHKRQEPYGLERRLKNRESEQPVVQYRIGAESPSRYRVPQTEAQVEPCIILRKKQLRQGQDNGTHDRIHAIGVEHGLSRKPLWSEYIGDDGSAQAGQNRASR